MSHTPTPGTDDNARPKRTIKKTQRAQEIIDSGEVVPGLPSPCTSEEAAFTPTTSAMARKGAVSDDTPAVRSRDEIPAGTTPIPTFTPQEFIIYYWQFPTPKNFLKLSDSRKNWKRKIDEQEKTQYIDDGCDDWYEFCGNRASYPAKDRNGFAMEFAVASSFLKRAKRAFWAGQSWTAFEFQERIIDSEMQAKQDLDPKRQALLLEEALDNKLRLAIFDALKRRLCEEIWLEAYIDPPGLVKLQLPKKDSKVPNLIPTTEGVLDMTTGKMVPNVDAEELKRATAGYVSKNGGAYRTLAEEFGSRDLNISESEGDQA